MGWQVLRRTPPPRVREGAKSRSVWGKSKCQHGKGQKKQGERNETGALTKREAQLESPVSALSMTRPRTRNCLTRVFAAEQSWQGAMWAIPCRRTRKQTEQGEPGPRVGAVLVRQEKIAPGKGLDGGSGIDAALVPQENPRMAKTTKTEQLRMMPVTACDAMPGNPQVMTAEERSALRESIARDGFLEPVLVRPMPRGRYQVVAGNHRVDVARELGMKAIPAMVRAMSMAAAKRIAVNLNSIHGALDVETLRAFLEDLDAPARGQVYLEANIQAALAALDASLAEQVESLQEAFPPAPESVARNLDELREYRKGSNQRVADRNDTERYLVIVYPTATDRRAAAVALGLPEDERYVASPMVRLVKAGAAAVVRAMDNRRVKAASPRHSGQAG